MQAVPGAMTAAYLHIDERLRAGGVVVLDGGVGSEPQVAGHPEQAADRPRNDTWGSLAFHEASEKSIRQVRDGAALAGRDDDAVAFACRTRDWPAAQQEEARGNMGAFVPLDLDRYLRPLAEIRATADAEHN